MLNYTEISIENLGALNSIVDDYTYFIDNRSYIHSSNILLCMTEVFGNDCDIYLRSLKPMTESFEFSLKLGENTVASIRLQNQQCFLNTKHMTNIRTFRESELQTKHRIIMRYQTVVNNILSLSDMKTVDNQWWSYSVTWIPKIIFKPHIDHYDFRLVKNSRKVKEIIGNFDGEIAWIQTGIKK